MEAVDRQDPPEVVRTSGQTSRRTLLVLKPQRPLQLQLLLTVRAHPSQVMWERPVEGPAKISKTAVRRRASLKPRARGRGAQRPLGPLPLKLVPSPFPDSLVKSNLLRALRSPQSQT